jgi:hypothetical protein
MIESFSIETACDNVSTSNLLNSLAVHQRRLTLDASMGRPGSGVPASRTS